jgi:hypothetical protein
MGNAQIIDALHVIRKPKLLYKYENLRAMPDFFSHPKCHKTHKIYWSQNMWSTSQWNFSLKRFLALINKYTASYTCCTSNITCMPTCKFVTKMLWSKQKLKRLDNSWQNFYISNLMKIWKLILKLHHVYRSTDRLSKLTCSLLDWRFYKRHNEWTTNCTCLSLSVVTCKS